MFLPVTWYRKKLSNGEFSLSTSQVTKEAKTAKIKPVITLRRDLIFIFVLTCNHSLRHRAQVFL